MKPSNKKPAGLLMPLPVPSETWKDITMDFITELPKVEGKTVIMVVVDRLSKYAHFSPLPPNFNVVIVADAFAKDIISYMGFHRLLYLTEIGYLLQDFGKNYIN